jgi:hypothetical protein
MAFSFVHPCLFYRFCFSKYLLNKAGEAGARIGAPRPESPNHAAQGMIGANSEPGEAPWGWSTGST